MLKKRKHGRANSSGLVSVSSSGSSVVRSQVSKVPPPHKRLCPKHGKPIRPSAWLRGCRLSGCWKCTTESRRVYAEKRAKRWEQEFIPCLKHPDRRCNKSVYVINCIRKCSSCVMTKANGERKDAFLRSKSRRGYKKITYNRMYGYWSNDTKRGFEMFERSTGFQLPTGWKNGKS